MTYLVSRRQKTEGSGGYTLIELMVAVGLFALIMMLASGAYLVMINVNRQTQAVATGINNLAFVLESMTRSIRTGSGYTQITKKELSFTDQQGRAITYRRDTQQGVSGPVGDITANGVALTAPAIDITSLAFVLSGGTPGDTNQPYVTIIVSGTVTTGPGKTESFTVETSVTMRGPDL